MNDTPSCGVHNGSYAVIGLQLNEGLLQTGHCTRASDRYEIAEFTQKTPFLHVGRKGSAFYIWTIDAQEVYSTYSKLHIQEESAEIQVQTL